MPFSPYRFLPAAAPRVILVLLILVVLTAGCGQRPKAPALSNEPVYQNKEEGLRFLVPEGWSQTAKSTVPPGRLDKEHLLVEYKQLGAEAPTSLEVTVRDLPLGEDLAKYLQTRLNNPGATGWRKVGEPAAVETDNVPGTRFKFSQGQGPKETTRSILVFRRGQRVYFFIATYASSDSRSRLQVRASMDKISWRQ